MAPVPPSTPPRLRREARGAAREIAESELGSNLGLAPVLSDVRGEAAVGGSAARGEAEAAAAAAAAAWCGREERCLRCRARPSFRRRRFCSDSGSTLSSTSTTHSAGQRAARIAVGEPETMGYARGCRYREGVIGGGEENTSMKLNRF